MPSQTNSRRSWDLYKIWNRKGHYYLGLYFLFFLWLFTFTGLLLNHGSWSFAEFWPNRQVTKATQQITVPGTGTDLERAHSVMRELGITGEVEWPAPKLGLFEFRANRPGHNYQISIAPEQGRATLEHTAVNGWGVMRALHTFTGARSGDPRNERDWVVTTLWALSMDAVAAGMVLMVISGVVLWWGIRPKRLLGALALILGTAACALLVAGAGYL